MRVFLLAIVCALAFPSFGHAEDWSLSTWHGGPRSSVAYKRADAAPVRHWREARHARPVRAERRPAAIARERHETPRPQCAHKVRGLGTQWIGTDGALEAAKKDWMERVRYDLGETYLDLTHAEDFEKRCGRVSIGQVAGQVMFRCEIVARPCKGDFVSGDQN